MYEFLVSKLHFQITVQGVLNKQKEGHDNSWEFSFVLIFWSEPWLISTPDHAMSVKVTCNSLFLNFWYKPYFNIYKTGNMLLVIFYVFLHLLLNIG
jgi:hypothetical protein